MASSKANHPMTQEEKDRIHAQELESQAAMRQAQSGERHRLDEEMELTDTLLVGKYNPLMRVQITGEIYRAEMPGLARSRDGMINLVPVVNLETGEFATLVLNTMTESALRRCPGGYIEKKFKIETGGQVEGKDYRSVKVFLIK